jgi:hypothetical protein
MSQCKVRLAMVWFSGAGLLFMLIFAQTIGGRYDDRVDEVWNWLLPNLMPTLSLITGALIMDFKNQEPEEVLTNKPFLFKLTFWFSIFYLLVMILSILLWPFSTEPDPLAFLQNSSLWLGPFQGLVSGLMGAFFIQKEQNSSVQ